MDPDEIRRKRLRVFEDRTADADSPMATDALTDRTDRGCMHDDEALVRTLQAPFDCQRYMPGIPSGPSHSPSNSPHQHQQQSSASRPLQQSPPSPAPPTPIATPAADVQKMESFAQALRSAKCGRCGNSLIGNIDLEQTIARQYEGQLRVSARGPNLITAHDVPGDRKATGKLALSLPCSKCHSSGTCMGCHQHADTTSGVHDHGLGMLWHCDQSLLALIWYILCGHDLVVKQNNEAITAKNRKQPTPTKSRPGRNGKLMASMLGVGYSEDAYDDYMGETFSDDEDDFQYVAPPPPPPPKPPKPFSGKKKKNSYKPKSQLTSAASHVKFAPLYSYQNGGYGHPSAFYTSGPGHTLGTAPAIGGPDPNALPAAFNPGLTGAEYPASAPPTVSPDDYGHIPGTSPYALPQSLGPWVAPASLPANYPTAFVPLDSPAAPVPAVLPPLSSSLANGEAGDEIEDEGEDDYDYDHSSFSYCDFDGPQRKRVKIEHEDPNDTVATVTMSALSSLLPCLRTDTDIMFATTMLLHSSILDRAAELLRSDSVEDGAKRGGLYESLLDFIGTIALIDVMGAATVFSQRRVVDGNLFATSCSQATSNESRDLSQPLRTCMDGLLTQANMILKRAGSRPQDFLLEESQRTLWICRRIEEVDRLLARQSVQAIAHNPAETIAAAVPWQKELAMLEVPDEVILASHAYAKQAKAMGDPPVGRMRDLVKEITRLKTGLPDGIFLRHGESRMDVMKCLITGPSGTPYANGLWEFDILCGANYPRGPPKVSFKTTGGGIARVNPNLYNCGKVCLSLLGTWSGEQWRPNESTILQVLVSIQAMIFCDEPHCNEPSYQNDRGTEQSKAYSRNVYAMTVKHAMLEWLGERDHLAADSYRRAGGATLSESRRAGEVQDHPRAAELWEEVVQNHFGDRAEDILATVETWIRDRPPESMRRTRDPAPPAAAGPGAVFPSSNAGASLAGSFFKGTGWAGKTLGSAKPPSVPGPPPYAHKPPFPSPPAQSHTMQGEGTQASPFEIPEDVAGVPNRKPDVAKSGLNESMRRMWELPDSGSGGAIKVPADRLREQLKGMLKELTRNSQGGGGL